MIDTKTYNKLHFRSSQMKCELDHAVDEPPRKAILMSLPSEIKGYNLCTKKWGKTHSRVF